MIVVIATYNKVIWVSLKNKFLEPEILPILLFSILYLIVLIFTINYFEHSYQSDDRFLAVIFIPVVGIIFLSIDKLIISQIPLKIKQINLILILVFGVWCIYPSYLLYENISNSYEIQGVVHNNIFNTPRYRNSETLQVIDSLIENSNVPITLYSNNPASIWFFARHDVKLLPIKSVNDRQMIISELSDTASSSKVYIVWLIPDAFEITITPQWLAKIMPLETMFTNIDGEIYSINNN